MSPLTGVVLAAALLLGIAGAAKALRPDGTRVALRTAGLPSQRWAAQSLGAVEVILAALALGVGGPAAAVVVLVAYLGFAAFSELLRRRSRGRASCGCFGGTDAPVTRLHVVINLSIAAAAAGSLADPVEGIDDLVAETPWAGAPAIALIALLTWLLQVALTALPALEAASRPAPSTGTAAATTLTISPKPKEDR